MSESCKTPACNMKGRIMAAKSHPMMSSLKLLLFGLGFFLLLASELAAAPQKLSAACGRDDGTSSYCECAGSNCLQWCSHLYSGGAKSRCRESCKDHFVLCMGNTSKKPSPAAPDIKPDEGGPGPKPMVPKSPTAPPAVR